MFSLWRRVVLVASIHRAYAVDLWCGKAYHPNDPAIDPGGRIDPPIISSSLLLNLEIRPRMQPYLEDDVTGAFIIDAALSHIHGQPYDSLLDDQQKPANVNIFFNTFKTSVLYLDVYRSDSRRRILNRQSVTLNSTGTQFAFSLEDFEPSLIPYDISLVAWGPGRKSHTAFTKLLRLPNRTDGGSTTKIDNLYGGLHVQTFAAGHVNSASWEPVLPYSYYLSGDWITNNPGNMATFKDYGYNILHIVPAGGLGYNFTQLDEWMDEAQRLGLWIMYDMRWTYQDMALVEWQVSRLKARPNMLLWYTADEPDGRVDPLDATKKAYDMIKSLDTYHPVSLCLNCQNYQFQEYSAGADIILSDTYPIGTNTSWSTKYNTVCNTTYGDCGCDNCVGFNNVSNVPARLDNIRNYEIQLGIPQKPLWGTPQAYEQQDFWQQTPTAAEEVAMTMLSINHGAKGIVMWLFPTTQELTAETSKLAKVLTGTCARFMLGTELIRGFGVDKAFAIDVSAWKLGNRLLVSVVNAARDPVTGTIELTLPSGIKASSVAASLWGGRGWNTAHGKLQGSGLPPLGTAIFILGLETSSATGGVVTS